jgi:hypothetical protein
MGAWGIGLYSNDFGMDVRSAIKVISRLPFDEKKLTEIAVNAFSETAENQNDEEYTIFWLVLADQFHNRGVPAKQVFATALYIIKSGKDLQVHRELGMSSTEIEKRRQVLVKLQTRLTQPVSSKSITVLKNPQPLIMSTGDVICFPIDKEGMCINPYISEKLLERYPDNNFNIAGWGIAVIIACGRVFDYISYYTPLIIIEQLGISTKPTLDLAKKSEGWRLDTSGTCSKRHFARMQLEIIGKIEIDDRKLKNHFQKIDNGIFAAINDISIANHFHFLKREHHLAKLSQITTD